MADYSGLGALNDFVEAARKAEVREVAISVSGDTRPTKVGSSAVVLQPVTRLVCSFEADVSTDDDPYATVPVAWEVVVPTGREEQETFDKMVKALRAKGLGVAQARAYG